MIRVVTWLQRSAAQIAKKLETEAARQFFLKTLQLVIKNNGDPDQIYPVWTQQQAQFNTELLAVLPTVVVQLFEEGVEQRTVAVVLVEFGKLIEQFPLGTHWLNLELGIALYQQALIALTQTEWSVEWAQTLGNLANAYTKRIQGDRAENIEQAIALYQQALTVRTQAEMPVEWAGTLNNLALAYTKRIQGDHAENIEQAIALYQQALTVLTQTALPVDWALVLNNLALAYTKRIQGDRADNLERAISLYQQALTVRTQAEMPVEWAQTLHNLGLAYTERIQGNHAENLERAIALHQQALTVLTQTALPVDWAQALDELAIAYTKRIQGDRADNLEQAIVLYEQVLLVRTQMSMPIEWAETLNNLANVYIDRIRGNHAENLERAVALYQQALTVRTQTALPLHWAQTLNNLAVAYSNPQMRGDHAENLEQAIALYQQTLSVLTQTEWPVEWAQTLNNLANVYAKRLRGDRAENIEQAIVFHQQALLVRTQMSMPIEWAQTLNNLAGVYTDRIRGDRAENIEQAITAYRSSLEIFRPELLPNYCRKVARDLGNLYSNQQRWAEAVPTYQMALQAAEILYQSAVLLDSKTTELAENPDLIWRAAYAFARCGNLQAAVITLEQGHARGLSESLDRDRADLHQLQQTHVQLFIQYRDLTAQLRILETQYRMHLTSEDSLSPTPQFFHTKTLQLRQFLLETVEQIRQIDDYADFLAQPNFDDIQQSVRADNPLIYLVFTPLGSLALIVTTSEIDSVWLNGLDEKLVKTLSNWFSIYEEQRAALQNYKITESAEDFQTYKRAEKAWYNTFNQVTHHLWEQLMAPLIAHLKHQRFKQATLIPTGYLSLLPLHAAWIDDSTQDTGKRYALDEILFNYAPNARSLSAAQLIAQQTTAETLLAIDNPMKDLPNSSREVETAIATFPQHQVLKHEEATVGAVLAMLPHYDVLHFSCHGTANLLEPLTSGLLMNDGHLILRDILALKLMNEERAGIRLAILSACETGLVGIENVNEVVSLPTGMLQAGVAGVVASFWLVPDLGTMILLMRFYDFWRIERHNPIEALVQAQRWVRDTTNRQKYDYFKIKLSKSPENQALTGITEKFLNEFMLSHVYPSGWESRDFAHPFHWAAFTYTGV